MGSYVSPDVLCPYYVRDDPKTCSITCEGILPGSTIKSHYNGRENMRRAMRKYCCERYQSCPWFRVASMKWEEPGH